MKSSAEKIAELRQAVERELSRPDADPTLTALMGAWRLVRPFARRPLATLFAELRLGDAASLDELLGMVAGAALELRSDAAYDVDLPTAPDLQKEARSVLDRVLAPGVHVVESDDVRP